MTVDTTTPAAVPEAIRSRLALALDVDDLVVATRLARDLQPWFGTMKVGLELFTAAGPDAIASLTDLGVDVFCDLKLHDIPNTVGRTARVLGALGARYVTLHTSGGVAMLRAAVQGLREGAAGAGLPEPTALAVTVLTSDPDWSEHLVRQRAVAGLEAGCGGFVCSVPDLPLLRELAPAAAVIWLDAPFATLVGRVPLDGRRPLASDRSEMERLYNQRLMAYQQAHLRLDSGRSSIEELVDQIVEWLEG
jgi:orotidine-5'-phosphate decarboxylase